MDLPEALAADGLTCVAGAGGKKTTLYHLANRLDRAVVTATVRIPIFDEHVARVAVTDDPVGAVSAADDWPLGLVPERVDEVRYGGYEPAVVADVAAAAAGPTLVKADGARNRLFKAPDDEEPQVPAATDTLVPIASAHVVGEPLTDEHVHRPERVAALTNLREGDRIEASHVARVLASERGGLKGAPPGATVVPVVNMCDDEALTATGREIARDVLARTDRVERIALTRMNRGELVDVVA
jgi:probable selenium-dependent hydroxylase accessory protein YqeC